MSDYAEWWSAANRLPCDLCEGKVVGAVRVVPRNRSPRAVRGLGRLLDPVVLLVCAAHITIGEPVYPVERRA